MYWLKFHLIINSKQTQILLLYISCLQIINCDFCEILLSNLRTKYILNAFHINMRLATRKNITPNFEILFESVRCKKK